MTELEYKVILDQLQVLYQLSGQRDEAEYCQMLLSRSERTDYRQAWKQWKEERQELSTW